MEPRRIYDQVGELHEVNNKIDDYIKSNDEYHKKQDELRTVDSALLKDMHKMLMGDPEAGEMGLIKQNKETYEVVTGLKFTGTFGKWVLSFIILIAAVVTIFDKS